MVRVVLDTDMGSDPDDAIALSLAIGSAEIALEGVTTVYGDVHLRARLAAKLLELGGCGGVPVLAGVEQPLLRNRPIWWTGDEGKGVLTGAETHSDSRHAVDFIIETVTSNPGQITLVGIGPLTNIAAAMIRQPSIARDVEEIVLMGGVTRLGDNGADLPHLEHNIKSDPEAAALVFSSAAPITMVGLDVTMKAAIDRGYVERIKAIGSPLTRTLGEMVDRWLGSQGRDSTPMHDPLAVSLLIDRSLVTRRRMRVQVEYDHRHPSGQTVALADDDGNVQVCLDIDSPRFLDLLLSRLQTLPQ